MPLKTADFRPLFPVGSFVPIFFPALAPRHPAPIPITRAPLVGWASSYQRHFHSCTRPILSSGSPDHVPFYTHPVYKSKYFFCSEASRVVFFSKELDFFEFFFFFEGCVPSPFLQSTRPRPTSAMRRIAAKYSPPPVLSSFSGRLPCSSLIRASPSYGQFRSGKFEFLLLHEIARRICRFFHTFERILPMDLDLFRTLLRRGLVWYHSF